MALVSIGEVNGIRQLVQDLIGVVKRIERETALLDKHKTKLENRQHIINRAFFVRGYMLKDLENERWEVEHHQKYLNEYKEVGKTLALELERALDKLNREENSNE